MVRPDDQAPARPHLDLALDDGGRIRLRLATHDDTPVLEAGFTHLSDDSRYTRFFTAMPRLSATMLGRLTDIDGHHRVAIAAFDPTRPSEVGTDDGYGVAVARWVRITPTADEPAAVPELAMTIIDEYQHRGIGTLLFEALVVAAELRGIPTLQAFVLTSNPGMLQLLRRFGAELVEPGPDDPGVNLLEVDIGLAVRDHVPPMRRDLLTEVMAP